MKSRGLGDVYKRQILKSAKGYRGQRSRLYRKAKEQWLHSQTYAYRDRRKRKGEFRKLWIQRINAAARMNDITYTTPATTKRAHPDSNGAGA